MRKLAIIIIIGWVMLLLFRFEGLHGLENMLTNKLTTPIHDVDPRIKIIAIDDESIANVGSWPWSRDIMADLIDAVAEGGATGVWPDVLFTEKSMDQNDDRALTEVLAKHENVYLSVYVDFGALIKPKDVLEQEYLKLPIFDIPEERLGHINILPDKDNTVRRVLPGVPTLEEEIIPSIDIRLANLLLPETERVRWDYNYFWFRGDQPIKTDERLQFGFFYASSPMDSKFDIVPAWKVIEGEIDPSYFTNSIVMIGNYAAQQDQFSTPFGKKQMNRIEIHANSIQALLDNKLYNKLEESYSALIILLVTMLSFVVFQLVRFRTETILLSIAIIGHTFFVYQYFQASGLMLPYFYVMVALLLAYAASVMEQYLSIRKEKIDQG